MLKLNPGSLEKSLWTPSNEFGSVPEVTGSKGVESHESKIATNHEGGYKRTLSFRNPMIIWRSLCISSLKNPEKDVYIYIYIDDLNWRIFPPTYGLPPCFNTYFTRVWARITNMCVKSTCTPGFHQFWHTLPETNSRLPMRPWMVGIVSLGRCRFFYICISQLQPWSSWI